MAMADLASWLDAHGGSSTVWYAKRLSANDTLANGTHQAGPYIPREFLFSVFPYLNRPKERNPDVRFVLDIDSHGVPTEVRAVWYNNSLTGGTRNETRLTGFGGRESPLLDPESTGTIALFVFKLDAIKGNSEVRAWVCKNAAEEDVIEDRIGPVEPGRSVVWSSTHDVMPGLFARPQPGRTNCRLGIDELPAEWITNYPSGLEIVRKAIALRPERNIDADTRIVLRRNCEYDVYLSIEEAIELPHIRRGFANIDEFIARAQSILQRRKARSGKSLELHTCEILTEEGFVPNRTFSHQPESEHGKRPDFLFPSETAYRDPKFSESALRMLAVKTTCRDRWRQIINEADRVKIKHLLTLQEGISENQYREMREESVRLVVPGSLHKSYPESVRRELLTVTDFLNEIRSIS